MVSSIHKTGVAVHFVRPVNGLQYPGLAMKKISLLFVLVSILAACSDRYRVPCEQPRVKNKALSANVSGTIPQC